MSRHVDMCWASPHLGGVNISWNELMELPVPDRMAIERRVSELREQELKILKGGHQVSIRRR